MAGTQITIIAVSPQLLFVIYFVCFAWCHAYCMPTFGYVCAAYACAYSKFSRWVCKAIINHRLRLMFVVVFRL